MSERKFDPEVVALLEGIARDPEASLLRIPKRPLLAWRAEAVHVITPHRSWLTRAEKHLVTAYREEAAWVLLQACIQRLKEVDPVIVSSAHPDAALVHRFAEQLHSRVEERELSALATGADVTAVGLAAGALRLAPCEHGFNCLAVAHRQAGQIGVSVRVLARFFKGSSSAVQRAQAWENLAACHVVQGRFERALECDRSAAETDERKPRFLAWCLTTALQAGDERAAAEMARRIAAHPYRAELSAVVVALRAGRTASVWAPTPKSRRAVEFVRVRGCAEVGEICGTFD